MIDAGVIFLILRDRGREIYHASLSPIRTTASFIYRVSERERDDKMCTRPFVSLMKYTATVT